MASVIEFIERRLRLKVNEAKSAVARPEDRHFLGFRLRLDPHTGVVEVLLSERTKRNAMERIRQLTPRNWGGSARDCIVQINAWLRGWHGFFGIASASEMQMMRKIDAHIRRRLRAIMLRHWKRKRTIAEAPRRAGRQAAERVAPGLCGPQVLVGAEPRGRGRPRPAQRVLRQARAVVRGRLASPGAPAHRRPRLATTGAMGMSRGREPAGGGVQQPAVPKSRIRTAYVRFCGSRGGQPSRLPEKRRWSRRARRDTPGEVPRRGEGEVSGGGRERRRGPRGGERGRGAHPERGVRPALVVVLAPVCDHDLRLGQAGELLDVEQLVADAGVEGLDERVLPRRARLDVRGAGPRAAGTSP